MPNAYSVFECKTNYRGHPTGTVFSLPKGSEDLKEKWISALHRDLAEDLPEDKYSFAYTILGRKILSALTGHSKLMVATPKYHALDQFIFQQFVANHQVSLSLSRLTDILQIEILISDILNYTNPELFESSFVLENILTNISCDKYAELLHDLSSIDLNLHLLQSIVFICGYAVYSYLKTATCHLCSQQLTENQDIEITDTIKYDLIRYIDCSSLKWPLEIVIESIVVLWKIIIKIDENETLRKHFYSSSSRKVLIQLTENMLADNFIQHWRDNCKGCDTSGWTILRKILSVCTNCILANKVRNVNSEITSSS
ncbi:hypothetical protein LOD99_86 [Oopsacas minuta]|uniref:PH domain-containing protein n=1 Tax=Oopsacas minuta TaxID=111878 RepID=A0AAV7K992_9METZ|nr:hypothetical protein LOD99_86 [Oopsacas minuta]